MLDVLARSVRGLVWVLVIFMHFLSSLKASDEFRLSTSFSVVASVLFSSELRERGFSPALMVVEWSCSTERVDGGDLKSLRLMSTFRT